jgi:hypothetical protein
MSTDYGVQKRAEGKAETRARTVWSLDLGGVQFRCLRTSWELHGGKAFVVQIKKQGGTWNNTQQLGQNAGVLLREIVVASKPLIDNLWVSDG